MTASPKRHRHRAAPAPRTLPAWWRSRAFAPIVSVGVVTAAVLTSASVSSGASTASVEPPRPAVSTDLSALAAPVTAPSDAVWTAPDAEAAWLGPAIQAEAARVAAEKAEAERQAAEAAAAQAAREAAAARTARDRAARRDGTGARAVPSSTPVGEVKQYAASLVGADQFGCLEALWQRESGWNPAATNRSSGAYGIPQSLPASKMASAGPDWQTNPMTQVRWGVSYIHGRYGSPCGAWAHSESHGWY